MRVAFRRDEGGSVPVRAGHIRAMRSAGIDAFFWDPAGKSVHDLAVEAAPLDVLVSTTYSVDDAFEKVVRKNPGMRVALFGSAWGPLADALPADEFPIVRVSEDEKRRLSRLKAETGRPDFVFIHASGVYLEGTMSGWREIGIEPVGILNGADACVYRPGTFRPHLACDASMASGYWGYKSRKLVPYVLPLTREPDLNVKLFGYSQWPTPSYLGVLAGPQDECDLFASSAVCMNVSEPHSTDGRYGCDIVERPWKVLLSGGFLVGDDVPEARTVFPEGCFVAASSPSDFHEKVRHFARNPDERLPYMKRGREFVLGGHTYHHRAAQLLGQLGFTREAVRCLGALGEVLGDR